MSNNAASVLCHFAFFSFLSIAVFSMASCESKTNINAVKSACIQQRGEMINGECTFGRSSQ